LTPSDVEASREILQQYELSAFVGTRLALQADLLDEVQHSLAVRQLQPDHEVYQSVLNDIIKKLNQHAKKYADIAHFLQAAPGQAYKEISLEDIEKFAERRDLVKEIYQNKLTRALIEQAKCDLKFLRNTAKNELVHLAHLQNNTHA
jgi:ABC-type transporter MlaC component